MVYPGMNGLWLTAFAVILPATGGCSYREGQAMHELMRHGREATPAEAVAEVPPIGLPAGHADKSRSGESAVLIADTPSTTAPVRMLVYNARLVVAVPDVEPAMRNAEKLAGDLGGYVQKVEKQAITLRVPAARFREAVDKFAAYGAVLDRNIDALDVTEEYTDLELRLTNARAMRKRLEELLAKAKDVKETLEIEKELNRIREEIERLEGKITYLVRQVKFSTIVVQWVPIERTMTRGRRPALPFVWLHELGVETLMRLGKM